MIVYVTGRTDTKSFSALFPSVKMENDEAGLSVITLIFIVKDALAHAGLFLFAFATDGRIGKVATAAMLQAVENVSLPYTPESVTTRSAPPFQNPYEGSASPSAERGPVEFWFAGCGILGLGSGLRVWGLSCKERSLGCKREV